MPPHGAGMNGVAGPTSIGIFFVIGIGWHDIGIRNVDVDTNSMKQTGAGTGRATVVKPGGSGSGTDFGAISLVSRTEDRHQSAANVP